MSTPIDDGGPAFPAPMCPQEYGLGGMSLRDWFAGQATEEDIIEHLPTTVGEARELYKHDGVTRNRAWARYMHADAMLAARERKED